MWPTTLGSSGIEEALGACILAPSEGVPTCTTGGLGTTDDYVILDAEHEVVADAIEARVDSAITPHRPVRLSLKAWPVELLVLRLRKPDQLPLGPP